LLIFWDKKNVFFLLILWDGGSIALQYQYNINNIFFIITLTIYYSLLSILSFIFLILFIKDNFVKQLIIYLFHTILITFLNMCEMSKTSFNLVRREYVIEKCYFSRNNSQREHHDSGLQLQQ